MPEKGRISGTSQVYSKPRVALGKARSRLEAFQLISAVHFVMKLGFLLISLWMSCVKNCSFLATKGDLGAFESDAIEKGEIRSSGFSFLKNRSRPGRDVGTAELEQPGWPALSGDSDG